MRQGLAGAIVLIFLGNGLVHAQPAQIPVSQLDPCRNVDEQLAQQAAQMLEGAASCSPSTDGNPECKGGPEWQGSDRPVECYFLGGAELLYWHVPAMRQTPLFTSGPDGVPNTGSLGRPDTVILSPHYDNGSETGYRLRLGAGVTGPDAGVGVEASYFHLSSFHTPQQQIVPATGTLARPVLDAASGQESSVPLSVLTLLSGSGNVAASTRLWGSDVSAGFSPAGHDYALLAGVSFLGLSEDLAVGSSTTALSQGNGFVTFSGMKFAAPANVTLSDTIQTRNHFYGGNLGVRIDNTSFHPIYFQLTAKVSVGDTDEEVIYNGSTTLNRPGLPPATLPGGLLALASNIGSTSKQAFTVVPEVGLNVGYELGNLRLFAGYNFLYWSNVLRPTAEVDRTVNANLLPTSPTFGVAGGLARPTPPLRQEDLMVYGLNLGLEICY
jgi:Putative beta barrel porin-7 (BBP7)